MNRILLTVAVAAVQSTILNAGVVSFTTDPFAGTTALTTPGRQVIGNELFVNFSPATDTFEFAPAVFGVNQIQFANNVIGSIPTTGVNVVVLETLDNDGNAGTPFGAGNAADLIAARITTSGPGFFIYFNSALNLPRLVYSTDLSDNTADLKILARMLNFSGNSAALPTFTAGNFTLTPEPSTYAFMIGAGLVWAIGRCKRVRR